MPTIDFMLRGLVHDMQCVREELGHLATAYHLAQLEQEIQTMALTVAELKANAQATLDAVKAARAEITGEIKVLQDGQASQTDLDQINKIVADTAAEAQALSDIIPNTVPPTA